MWLPMRLPSRMAGELWLFDFWLFDVGFLECALTLKPDFFLNCRTCVLWGVSFTFCPRRFVWTNGLGWRQGVDALMGWNEATGGAAMAHAAGLEGTGASCSSSSSSLEEEAWVTNGIWEAMMGGCDEWGDVMIRVGGMM